ncbi:MAG: hypothetical protein ABJB86_06970 [Bacteroidota bacterium]
MKQKLIAATLLLAPLLPLLNGCKKSSNPSPAPPQSQCVLTQIAAPIAGPDGLLTTFTYTNSKISTITNIDSSGGNNNNPSVDVFDYSYGTDNKLKSIKWSFDGGGSVTYAYYTDTSLGGVIVPTVELGYFQGSYLKLYYTKRFYNSFGQLTSIRTDSSDGVHLFYVSGDTLVYPNTSTQNYTKIFHRFGKLGGNGSINYFTDTYTFTYDDKPSPKVWPEVSGTVTVYVRGLDYSYLEPTTNNVTGVSYVDGVNNGTGNYTYTNSYTYNNSGYPLTKNEGLQHLVYYYAYSNCK